MKVLSFPSAYPPGQSPYDIFKDRVTAISSITTGIKNIIANKFINNQLKMLADNILNEIDEQKSIDLISLINEKPSEEIYPANLDDTIGQFYDFVTHPKIPSPESKMGPMMQKELMTGGLPAAGGVAPTPTPTTETMIPKTDISQLYNAIKSMPSGDVNWANLLKTMTEKKPWFMGGPTGPEQTVLNQMLGQVVDPKTKMLSDINLAKTVQETFYPEAEKPTEWEKKTELFLQTNPTVEEVKEFVGGRIAPDKLSDFETKWNLLMQRDHTLEEEKKLIGAYVAGTTPVDIKSIFENIPPGFELSSYNISATGAPSFSFRPIDTTTPYEFKTWDEAKAFLDTHPQEGFIGKIETEKGGFDVNFYKETEIPGELKALTPSDIKSFEIMLYGGGEGEGYGVITPEDYVKVKDYIERTKKNFPIPPYLDITERNLESCLDEENKIINIDLYKYFYQFYKSELKGELPKYLPPELIPVSRTGFWKNKIEYGSALADDNELDFEAMEKDGVTEEEIMKKLEEIRER